MNKTSARFLLRHTGAKLKNARDLLAKAMEEAKGEMVIAHNHGISVTEISRELGVTRQTVYTVLDEAKRKSAS